ncbi:MAG: chorismate mutase [Candidatus Humimicrobiaceae bacterium]|jgi:chorismate mutase|nr:chorismate mutase [Actinomycetota bacterium]MDD5600889.1 chorismate mutase [Actinomycetota bacterium]MDY0027707.1 chorismate mutase [Candidatus Humimicrobiaceae bacterium]
MKSENDFKEKLNKYREEIDEIDKNIVDLLNKRAVVVMEIKKLKEERNIPLYDARREDELLENIIKYNKGPLYSDNISQIFECILRNVQVLKKDENL